MVTLDSRDLTAYYAQRGWRRIGGDEVDGEDVVVYDGDGPTTALGAALSMAPPEGANRWA